MTVCSLGLYLHHLTYPQGSIVPALAQLPALPGAMRDCSPLLLSSMLDAL